MIIFAEYDPETNVESRYPHKIKIDGATKEEVNMLLNVTYSLSEYDGFEADLRGKDRCLYMTDEEFYQFKNIIETMGIEFHMRGYS